MSAAHKQLAQTAQPLPQYPERQGLSVVKKKRSKQLKRKSPRAVVAGITAIALALCFALVAVEARLGTIGYEINDVKTQISETVVQCEQLELQVAQLRSLDRIESYAIYNLGMVYLNSEDILYLDYNSTKAATAADNAAAATGESAVQSAAAATDVTPVAADAAEQEQSLFGKLGELLRNIFAKPATAVDV